MYECAQVAIYIADDGKPVVQLVGGPLFVNLAPLGKAVAVSAAKQLCAMIIDAIVEQNPDSSQEILDTLKTLELKRRETEKLN